MMHYPDIQTKIQAELDQVANGRTFIDLNDKVDILLLKWKGVFHFEEHGQSSVIQVLV